MPWVSPHHRHVPAQALVSPCLRVLGAQNSAFHSVQCPVPPWSPPGTMVTICSTGGDPALRTQRTLALLIEPFQHRAAALHPAALIAIYSVECLWSSHKMSPHGKLYHYWLLAILFVNNAHLISCRISKYTKNRVQGERVLLLKRCENQKNTHDIAAAQHCSVPVQDSWL